MVYQEVRCKLFTVREYYQMAKSGILPEDARVELIKGEIVEKNRVSVRHAACVKRLTAFLTYKFRQQAIDGVHNPIRLDKQTEPEPDLMLLRYRDDYYASFDPADLIP